MKGGAASALIVDGGTGQLNVAMEVLDELDVSGVDVIGVVKPYLEAWRYGYARSNCFSRFN